MGKRFGRNQKQAMREHIRLAELVIASRDKTISRLEIDLKEANIIVNRTAEVLGQHFVSLPVKTLEVEEIIGRFHHEVFNRNSIFLGTQSNTHVRSLALYAVEYIDTHKASAQIDELQRMIHMRYQSISGDVAYGLSQKAWLRLSDNQKINLIKNDIAYSMAKHLVENHNNRSFN